MIKPEPAFLSDPDLRESSVLRQIFDLFSDRANPRLLVRLARRLEGGQMLSRTLRRVLWHRYGVRLEAFSYGAFHEPGTAAAGLTVCRYASIAKHVMRGHNHPADRISMSPIFYEAGHGITDRMTIDLPSLEIGPDAWLGSNTVVLAGCRKIGVGAIVGAGAIVTKDVPDFAIVVGAPARIVRYRFPEPMQEAILRSRWWQHSPRDLAPFKEAFSDSADTGRAMAALAEIETRLTRDGSDRTRSSFAEL